MHITIGQVLYALFICVGILFLFINNPTKWFSVSARNTENDFADEPFHVLHHPAAPPSGEYLPSSISETARATSVVVPFERPDRIQRTDTGWRGLKKRA